MIVIYQNTIPAAQLTEYMVDWKVYVLFLFVILLLSRYNLDLMYLILQELDFFGDS